MAARCEDQLCVFLWAVPRSLSTIMTKCMSFVEGVQVWNEPYMSCYNKEKFRDPEFLRVMQQLGYFEETSKPKMPQCEDAADRGKRSDNSLFEYSWVKEQLESQDPDKKIIFVKDIAFAMRLKYDYLPSARNYRHTFMIRDPHRMFPSYRKMMSFGTPEEYKDAPVLDYNIFCRPDRIYKQTYDLWKYTKETLDQDAIIIDGTELASHPEKILTKYFQALGIPFKEDYLEWDASADVMKNWKGPFQTMEGNYSTGVIDTALNSSHFKKSNSETPSRGDMPPDVIRCIDASMPYYNEMYEQRIKP